MSSRKLSSRGVGSLVTMALSVGLFPATAFASADTPPAKPGNATSDKISYYKQVRPILQAQCQGCHQPAKAGGGYVMTRFDQLMAGGDSKEAAVVKGKPDDSHIIAQITPEGGKAEMPKDKPPLSAPEIETIKTWVAQGAEDDTPPAARLRFDKDHPPVYSRNPVLTAMDYSPDGSLLAIGGFHEVLLWKSDGSELVARLVGLSERIESVRFSPKGEKLAVTGGQPGRMGEIQVWDVAKRKLTLSVPVTYDTTYGASWSPDGAKIAFGCADNSVRAIDAKTGTQLLFMGSHNDWVLDTAFSKEGTHLISVGRDMTAKLTEVATQRFIDNMTSITPGALKGGLASVSRLPKRDEILMGGADGAPKLYRIFRETARVIGDDANLIGSFTAMPGRIFSVALSADGKRFAAGSSLDSKGQVDVYDYTFDPATTSDPIKKILAKDGPTRSVQERAELDKTQRESVKRLASVPVSTPIYALAFQPDGKKLAAAGGDGVIRLFDPVSGKVGKEFSPATVTAPTATVAAASGTVKPHLEDAVAKEPAPTGLSVERLSIEPGSIRLRSRFETTQLVVSAKMNSGETIDVTRMVDVETPGNLVEAHTSGLIRPKKDGEGSIKITLSGQSISVPVLVSGTTAATKIDFVNDVAPVLSKLGCNAGTCHGSAQGKNGFKLSLRGYDPLFDVRALTDDHASRRVNLASPDDSLMLLKPTGAVPHVGGVVMIPGEPAYQLIRNWISSGSTLDTTTQKAAKIEVFPVNPVVERIGMKQQLRVVATYPNGETRDVSREAFLDSGNGEVATANRVGLITALRRGEAPILVRYDGNYAATTLTVMGDRGGFVWEQPPAYNKIDELSAAKWKRLKIRPSEPCTDVEFFRRVYLDLTGLPPTLDDVQAFLADKRESRVKREAVVGKLIGSPEFVDYWTNKWADLLQVNRKFLGVEGSVAFRNWIRRQVASNTPYDQFAKTILTASGSNKDNPAASYYKILRDPASTMENTTQLFLAVRFNCNKCHDHPFERWTQDQYYQTSAFFARVDLKEDPASAGRKIGGTDVEAPKPFYESVSDKPDGEIKHERTGQLTPPKFPFHSNFKAPEKASRRVELASWLTSADNAYFAKSYVNRLWGYLMGVGIIEPIDDIRAGNPATNPELLDHLSSEFVKSGFNVRHILKLITTSRTYQLSVAPNKWNQDDKTNYSHALARRLPAEVLLDSVYRVTGSQSKFPGVAPGTRAAALPDSGVELPSGFLTTFGRPARESACECERTSGLQLGPVMALLSGPTLADAIADPVNELSKLVGREADDSKLINELFMRIMNRPATTEEIAACKGDVEAIDADHLKIAAELGRRETDFAMQRPKLERDRETALNLAQAALAKYEGEAGPKKVAYEKEKAEKVSKAETGLKSYEETLPAKVAAWEKAQSTAVRWLPIESLTLKASNGATLAKEGDAIVATGNDGPGIITVTAETDLTEISGIRLEVLADPRYPNAGPGRASDGNFVITEFQLNAAPKSDPKKTKTINLVKPVADFTQASFDIAQAVDNDLTKTKGWAISPSYGVTHWATFETDEPVGTAGGTSMTFTIHHQYGKAFMPGRFRISVTKVAKPIGLGLPDDYRATLATVPELRTRAQRDALLFHYRGTDAEWLAKAGEVFKAKNQPMPADPLMQQLKDAVALATKPVPIEPRLVQLRQDVEMSIKQAAARRLTAAQDVAWALINSPAFLFNH